MLERENREFKRANEIFFRTYKEYLKQRVPRLSGSVSDPVARRRSAH